MSNLAWSDTAKEWVTMVRLFSGGPVVERER